MVYGTMAFDHTYCTAFLSSCRQPQQLGITDSSTYKTSSLLKLIFSAKLLISSVCSPFFPSCWRHFFQSKGEKLHFSSSHVGKKNKSSPSYRNQNISLLDNHVFFKLYNMIKTVTVIASMEKKIIFNMCNIF